MKNIKPLSVIMTAVMLVTMLASCSSGVKAKKKNVVKEDDPWYETTRFKLSNDMGKDVSMGASTGVCSGGDRLYSLYCYSNDGWWSAKTKIDTYDLEGNILNRQEVTTSDDYYVSNIYSLSSTPDGKTINAIVNLNSTTSPHFYAFVNIDPETGKISNVRDVFGGEGKILKKDASSVFSLLALGDYTIALLAKDYMGGIPEWVMGLFRNGEFITQFDMSTVSVLYFFDGFSINESTGSLYAVGLGRTGCAVMEFDIYNGSLKNNKLFGDLDEKEINFGEYTPTDNGDLCKIDSFGNIMKLDVNTMTPETMIDTNWYSPYFYPADSDEYSVVTGVMSCNDERTILVDSETRTYGCDEYTNTEYIRVLRKADKNPHAGKEIIELALPQNSGLTEYLSTALYEFNRTDNEYIIRVWDKYKSGFVLGRNLGRDVNEDDQQIFKMIQDLQGDEAPDLAVGIQRNYAMRDEIFLDLSDFLDPDIMAQQYSNIIDAGRINGKLYFLPVSLEIEGLVTNKELIKDGAVGITFDEYDRLIEEDMNGFSPYDYPASYYYNKRDFLLSCIDTKSAIEGDTVEFGTEQFRAAAEYTKDHFEFDDLASMPDEYLSDWNKYRGESYYARISDYLDYVHACNDSKGQYNIIGTPSVDASGPRFKAIETISVSATTDVQDGCKKFLNYLFSGVAFDSGECEFRSIVTNKQIMTKNVDTLTKLNNEVYDKYRAAVISGSIRPAADYEKTKGDKSATDEMRESFMNSLSTISTYNYEDYTIVSFVLEELAPYYAGDRSLDDAIRYINDRTNKYVKEM